MNRVRSQDPRNRMTSGINGVRLRLEAKRSLRSLVVILVGLLIGVVGAAWLATQLSTTLLRGTHEYKFLVGDAYGATAKISDMRFKGIRAGKITKIEWKGRMLEITGELSDEYGAIYKNARAELRPATPLQDVYLDVTDPGTPAAGQLGSQPLADGRTAAQVNIDDVLQVFKANERTRLKQLLDNLGNGTADRGDSLRAAIVQVTPLVTQATRLTDALATRKRATARLVHNAGILTETLGSRNQELRRLVSQGAATFGSLQAGSNDLNSTLVALPGTLRQINGTFSALDGVVGRVDTAVNDLKPVANRLPGTLRTVDTLNGALGPAASRLRAPVRRLVPLAQALAPVTTDLSAAAKALRPQVPALDYTTTEVAKCKRGVTGFFQWNASLSKFGDSDAPIPRGNLQIGAPDSGAAPAKRTPGPNCSTGTTIGGRPAQTGDNR